LFTINVKLVTCVFYSVASLYLMMPHGVNKLSTPVSQDLQYRYLKMLPFSAGNKK